ncbi:MAG: PAS domain S-box protein [Nitrospirae bacterium]|nr:PAS domain S-box protein [Nitrospirota bacterium]
MRKTTKISYATGLPGSISSTEGWSDLSELDNRYQAIFNTVSDAIFVYDAVIGKLTDVNDKVMDLYGYRPEEAISVNLQAISVGEPPYDYQSAEELKRLALEGIPQKFQWLSHDRLGNNFWAEINLKLININKRNCLIAVVKDISQRRSLEEIGKRYEFIVNTSKEFMTLINRDYTYDVINASYGRAHGKTPQSVIGKSVRKVWGADVFNNVIKKHLDKCFAGEEVNYQSWFNFHTLGPRFLDVTYYPYYNLNGQVTHAVVVSRDITAHQQAEDILAEASENLKKTVNGAIKAISLMIEMRDPYTAGHQRRVSDLAVEIARVLKLSDHQVEGIRITGFLHDIGKIVVPAEILSKPTKLNDYELNIIKMHSQVGADILQGIEFPWPVAKTVLEHHERLDGSGYPMGLRGNDICLEAKIVAVADVVESVASHRPYRAALGIIRALDEISAGRGILYEPKVVDVCTKLFRSHRFKFD